MKGSDLGACSYGSIFASLSLQIMSAYSSTILAHRLTTKYYVMHNMTSVFLGNPSSLTLNDFARGLEDKSQTDLILLNTPGL